MKHLPIAALLLTSSAVHAHTWIERPDWAKAIADQQLTGVVAVCSYPEAKCQASSPQRAVQRFIPASTYKIPHLLIALDTGVTPATDTVFKWDGKPQALKPWERDHTYRGLLVDSVVPVFQGFARQIGEQRMQSQLRVFDYGNANVGGGIDHFWLDGELRISAAEQIAFLRRLQSKSLPIKAEHQWRTHDAMLVEATDQFVVRGKTGYSKGAPGYGESDQAGIGWWVGWIETGTHTHIFASNYDITVDAQLPLRKSIARTLFLKEGWLGQP